MSPSTWNGQKVKNSSRKVRASPQVGQVFFTISTKSPLFADNLFVGTFGLSLVVRPYPLREGGFSFWLGLQIICQSRYTLDFYPRGSYGTALIFPLPTSPRHRE